jgi:hypothetical protein
MPEGNASVKEIPLSDEIWFGLLTVKVRVVVPFAGTARTAYDFVITGGNDAVRVLRHMAVHGYDQCVPTNDDPTLQQRPLVDFKAGYVKRSGHVFPKAGSRPPWRLGMNYAHDVLKLRYGRIEDGVLRFSRQPAPVPVYQETRVAS